MNTKRVFDTVLSFVMLLVLFPLMACIALTIYIAMGRPVLFCQRRPGLYGREFILYKFRTMTEQGDADHNTLSETVRLTSLGKFLRALSLDELPELFNVLKGDMSIVGPRPLLTQYW